MKRQQLAQSSHRLSEPLTSSQRPPSAAVPRRRLVTASWFHKRAASVPEFTTWGVSFIKGCLFVHLGSRYLCKCDPGPSPGRVTVPLRVPGQHTRRIPPLLNTVLLQRPLWTGDFCGAVQEKSIFFPVLALFNSRHLYSGRRHTKRQRPIVPR